MIKITSWVIAILTAGTILYDIIPAVNKTPGDTISEVLFASARKRPIIAVAWGILTGHLFWGQDND